MADSQVLRAIGINFEGNVDLTVITTPGTGSFTLGFDDAGALYIIDDTDTATLIATSGVGGAPVNAKYIVQTADATLTNEQALGSLATGLVKNTTTTGILSIALAGTDYLAPAAIGVTVQAWDANLDTIAAIAPVTDNFIIGGVADWQIATPAQVRTALSLVVGTNVQAWDTNLDQIAALTPTDDNFIVGSGGGTTWALKTPAQARTSLGVGTGDSPTFTNVVLTGYLELPEQAAPGTPTNAARLFIDTSNRFSWIGENGYIRTFDGTANTASRIYVLPDQAGTMLLATYTGAVAFTGTFSVIGSADSVQTIIRGNATQTSALTQWQNSSSTVLATITSGGSASFGTATVPQNNAAVYSNKALADLAATGAVFYSNGAHTITSNNAFTNIGMFGVATLNQNSFNGTATLGPRGVSGQATASGASGTVTGAGGVVAQVTNTGAGTLTNAYAFFAQTSSNSGGGTLANSYGLYVQDQTAGSTSNYAIFTNIGNVSLLGSNTIASATSATWKGIEFRTATAILTGSTAVTTSAGFNYIEIAAPILSAASALTVSNAATFKIAGPPTGAGVGPAAITTAYSLWVGSGTSRYDGSVISVRAGITTTSTDGFWLLNTTAALVGTTVQMSPRVHWQGAAWETTGGTSKTISFIAELLPTTGATAGGSLIFSADPGTGSYTNVMMLDTNGSAAFGTPSLATNQIIRAVKTFTDPSATIVGVNGNITVSDTLDNATVGYGVQGAITVSVATTKTHSGTITGLNAQATASGAGNTSGTVSGLIAQGINSGTGTVAVLNGVTIAAGLNSGGGAVTTNSGLVIGNMTVGTTTTTNASNYAIFTAIGAVSLLGSATIASNASSTWKGIEFRAATATVTGSTNITTSTGFNYIEIAQPTISAGSALSVTNSATLKIAGAPTGAGAGPATLTNTYAIWIGAGISRFDNQITNIRSAIATTSTTGFLTTSNTAATVGVPVQISPRVLWGGFAWETTGGTSKSINAKTELIPTTGATAGGYLLTSIDPGTGTYVDIQQISSTGVALVGTSTVTGNADSIQLKVVANATQTTSLVEFQNSSGTPQFTLTSAGVLTITGAFQAAGITTTSSFTASRATNAVGGAVSTGIQLTGSSSATVGTQTRMSPQILMRGRAWDGSASETTDFSWIINPVAAGTPTADLVLYWELNSGGPVSRFSFSSSGNLDLTNAGVFKISGTQVVKARITGYTNAWTGATNRATAYDPSTVTLVQLAEAFAAVRADLITHGLLGV